jgi:hypothetical protein
MKHHVLDFFELQGMNLNLIPVSNLEGLKERKWSLFRLLLFLL